MNRAYEATSSQVQPEPILKVGTYQGGSALISKLTLGGQSLYVLGRRGYFTELSETVTTAYDHAVTERLSYKRACHGRDVADVTLKAIMDFVRDGTQLTVLQNNGSLQSVVTAMRNINKRYPGSQAMVQAESYLLTGVGY